MSVTMLPPNPAKVSDEYRFPYANEFIQLSFEGHHKKFEVFYELYGKRPSYVPAAPRAAGELEEERGFFAFLKDKLTHLYGDE